jgi:hypothetical protein
MANEVALTTAARVEIVGAPAIQLTLPCVEAIAAGDAVRIDTTTGKWTKSNGSSAGEARVWGIATRAAAAGEAVTAIRKGVMDGFALTALAYDAAIYLSDTDGRLSTVAGTVSTVLGRVIAGTSTTLGTAYDKILSVEVGG